MTFSKFLLQSLRTSFQLAMSLVVLGTMMACEEQGQPEEASGEAARDRYGVLNATFYVDKIGASTTETLGYNSWGFPNKKKFNFRACFKDQLLRGALQNWDVIILDGTSQKIVQTDFGGCANWSEVYSFDYFAPESYIEVRRVFNVTGGHRGDVAVVLGVNPWSGSVVDLRYDEIEDVAPNANGPATFTATMSSSTTDKATTVQKDISLTYQGHAYNDFEIDHNLSLKVAHYYQVEFSPKIFRKTLAKESAGSSPDQGLVRIKAILLRDDLNNQDLSSFDNYITAFEHTFSIDAGSVKKQIILKFPDITAVSSRMKALVRVEPIVDSPSVVGANFEGYLGALPGGDFDLVSSNYDVNKIYNEFTTKERQIDREGLSGVGLLRATNQAVQITMSDLVAAQHPSDCYMDETLEDRDCRFVSFARATCNSLGMSEAGMCYLPALALSEVGEFTEGWFVENRAPVSVKRRGITHASEKFSMSVGISNNRSLNSSTSYSISLDFLNLLSPIGAASKVAGKALGFVGSFFSGGQSWSYARSTSRAAGVSATQSLSLESRAQEFDIETTARYCMVYSVTEPERAASLGIGQGSTFQCDDAPSKVKGIETYYYVNGAGMSTDAWTDGNSLAENPWLMFIRGNSSMGVFRQLVSKKSVRIELTDFMIRRDATQIPQALYERVNQKFPGMISEVVSVEE